MSNPERVPPLPVVPLAVEAATLSPCRSQRGAVLFRGDFVLASGYNDKPPGFSCDASATCKATCRADAVHAEQAALLIAGRMGLDVAGADLLHVKVVKGLLVPSGPPSCVQCSKLALFAGVAGVWLYHEAYGWTRYPADQFHALSVLASQESA